MKKPSQETSPVGAVAPAREVFLHRPEKRAEIKRLAHVLLSQVINIIIGGSVLIGLLVLEDLYLPQLDRSIATIVLLALGSYMVWHVERRRSRTRQRSLVAAARATAGEPVRDFTFGDGSKGAFAPTAVLQVEPGLVIAIDAQHAFIRFVRTGIYPGLGHDWITELPANTDVDVTDHPVGRKGKPVPSLIFSSEEEDGFKVTAFALAPESIADARRVVTELRAKRNA